MTDDQPATRIADLRPVTRIIDTIQITRAVVLFLIAGGTAGIYRNTLR